MFEKTIMIKKLLIESSTENIIIESNYDGWERK